MITLSNITEIQSYSMILHAFFYSHINPTSITNSFTERKTKQI